MNLLGALGVVVMTYEQNASDDTSLYSLDDDTGGLYNVGITCKYENQITIPVISISNVDGKRIIEECQSNSSTIAIISSVGERKKGWLSWQLEQEYSMKESILIICSVLL